MALAADPCLHPTGEGAVTVERGWARTGLRVLGAALVGIIVRLTLQPLLPAESNPLLPPSAIVERGLLPPVFFAYGVLVYGLLGVVYVWLDPPGRGAGRGLRFGALFAGMWGCYLIEPLPHAEGASLGALLGYPAADATGLLALGAALGWALPAPRGPDREWGRPGWDVAIVALAFAAVRLAGSATLPLYTWLDAHPLLTGAWAALTGAWLGCVFRFVRPLLPTRHPLGAAAAFAVAVIGVDLLLFNGFMFLVTVADPADLLLRTALDVVGLFLGAWAVGVARPLSGYRRG